MREAVLYLKYHSLRDKIGSISNLYTAFYNVKRNKGTAGVDKVSIKQFGENLEENIQTIHRQLMSREYDPKPVLRRWIPKGSHNRRPLGIPTVRDRVIQQAFKQVLEPIFEPLFHPYSYGYRPKRSCHDAIAKIVMLWKQGYCEAADTDIEGFFDNIDHDLIMRLVRQKVSDGWVLRSIKKMLKAQTVEDGHVKRAEQGTPQGGVLSPLLANIVLNELDWRLQQEGIKFVRYADDFVCLTKSEPEAAQTMDFLQRYLKDNLLLKISAKKSSVTDFWRGFSYLGCKFGGNHVGIKDKSLEKFKDKVRQITKRSQNSSNNNIRQVIIKLNPVFRGFANYFQLAKVKTEMRNLDCWVRMRIRAMKYKRISPKDNFRIRNKRFRKWKLTTLSEIYNKHNAALRYTSSPVSRATLRGG